HDRERLTLPRTPSKSATISVRQVQLPRLVPAIRDSGLHRERPRGLTCRPKPLRVTEEPNNHARNDAHQSVYPERPRIDASLHVRELGKNHIFGVLDLRLDLLIGRFQVTDDPPFTDISRGYPHPHQWLPSGDVPGRGDSCPPSPRQ